MGFLISTNFFISRVFLSLIDYILAWFKLTSPAKTAATPSTKTAPERDTTRDIAQFVKKNNADCVVFFGSQTGTAEDYAKRIASEGKRSFGLCAVVADLEDYDYDHLADLPCGKLLIFVLATYGEGEPTDNAVEFHQFLNCRELSSVKTNPLNNITYAAFGLGNSAYEKFNWMVRSVDETLQNLGAIRLGQAGEGDDGKGDLEEEFLTWKESMWKASAEVLQLTESSNGYEATVTVTPRYDTLCTSPSVFRGELNPARLMGNLLGPYSAQNPYLASISEASELFSNTERNCLHLDIDIGESGMTYTTGDHIAVWPNNPNEEVDRLLRVLGLSHLRDQVIDITPVDHLVKTVIPSPTTFDALFRFYLEICAPVPRELCATLASFAPNEDAKSRMESLSRDKHLYNQRVRSAHLNLASLLEMVGNGKPWPDIPHSAIVESIVKLQPRYYSISSSSLAQPNKVSITAVVESKSLETQERPFKGLTTNYLLALKYDRNGEVPPAGFKLSYQLQDTRNPCSEKKLPIHIRRSTFRLPEDVERPVIMVGAGTGVAPFRGFVQERGTQAEQGRKVGEMILIFGCRKSTEDFIYSSEWKEYKAALGSSFQLIMAFSREGVKKNYVQHQLQENGERIARLVSKGARFYVCGDASNMARQVFATLGRVLVERNHITEQEAAKFLSEMKSRRDYQEDVW